MRPIQSAARMGFADTAQTQRLIEHAAEKHGLDPDRLVPGHAYFLMGKGEVGNMRGYPTPQTLLDQGYSYCEPELQWGAQSTFAWPGTRTMIRPQAILALELPDEKDQTGTLLRELLVESALYQMKRDGLGDHVFCIVIPKDAEDRRDPKVLAYGDKFVSPPSIYATALSINELCDIGWSSQTLLDKAKMVDPYVDRMPWDKDALKRLQTLEDAGRIYDLMNWQNQHPLTVVCGVMDVPIGYWTGGISHNSRSCLRPASSGAVRKPGNPAP